MTIDLKEIDKAFDAMILSAELEPEKWRESINGLLAGSTGINELRELSKLKAIIMNFIHEFDILSPDRVVVEEIRSRNVEAFIRELCEVNGYKKV